MKAQVTGRRLRIIILEIVVTYTASMGAQYVHCYATFVRDAITHIMPSRYRGPWGTGSVAAAISQMVSLISRFMGPTWGTTGSDRTQVGPMLDPWTLLSGMRITCRWIWRVLIRLITTSIEDECKRYMEGDLFNILIYVDALLLF